VVAGFAVFGKRSRPHSPPKSRATSWPFLRAPMTNQSWGTEWHDEQTRRCSNAEGCQIGQWLNQIKSQNDTRGSRGHVGPNNITAGYRGDSELIVHIIHKTYHQNTIITCTYITKTPAPPTITTSFIDRSCLYSVEQLRVQPIDIRYISELSTKIRISQNAARKRSVEPSTVLLPHNFNWLLR
jgi:hypothetical protein